MFLAGDIGGTSIRLALFSYKSDRFCYEFQRSAKSRDYPSLEDAVLTIVGEDLSSVEAICLAVPGPVFDGCVQLTNLSWEFSESSMREKLGGKKVRLVNDLVAVAAARPFLGERELLTLHPGGNVYPDNGYTILAPGTGLGHAFATKTSHGWHYIASEGGHIDFAPRDELTWQLLNFLLNRYQRVSYERVVSGPGLANIYEFLGTVSPYQDFPDFEEDRSHWPELISEKGLSGECPRSAKCLDMFSRILGGLAGNFVLAGLFTGGVYLGGGIPPRLKNKLSDGSLVEEYLRQGRMSPIVEDTPLAIILNDSAGLFGAAQLASEL